MILRTVWFGSESGKNFVKTMFNLTATQARLKVAFYQTGTPTYVWDPATVLVVALKNPVKGIYHYSNEGVCSWYDFTMMIAEYSGNTGCDILPCHSEEFPSPVKRPAYSVLDKTKVKATFGIIIPYWIVSLKDCISHF